MRGYAIVGMIVGIVGCRTAGNGKVESAARDTTTVPGAPAVTPSPPRDSITSRPRTPDVSTTRRTTTGGTKRVLPPEPAGQDTVRGIVSVVGTEHERRVTIARPGGGKRVEITGPLATLVGHLGGADVWVAGTTAGTALEAARFIVRTVDGMPALDGTLKTEGSALYLVTTDGTRTRIVAPPPPLLGHDGARVWITGDPARSVASFGFIDPPR